MGDTYTSVTVTGYNTNPPVDDGSQTEANRVKWATIKEKLDDPLKTAVETINTNVVAAFGKIDGGVTSTAISYQVVSGDQGKLVRASASGITITTPDATDVDAPFVFGFLNDSDGDITLDGSGSQTIDGDASVTVQAGAGGRIRTDGTNWFTDGQIQRTQVKPQGYLTLVNEATAPLSPFPASDQSAKTAVYYRPDVGNLLPIPDGTRFIVREFSELTLTLVAAHAANTILDVFAALDPATGNTIIGTGPAWTTASAGGGARGTGAGTTELEKLKGLPVNKVAITLRNSSTTYSIAAKCAILLGSLYMDGVNGQISCLMSFGTSRKWGVSNAYNRRPIIMKAGSGSASWDYRVATIRQQQGAVTSFATAFTCLQDEFIKCSLRGRVSITIDAVPTAVTAFGGIGFDSSTVFSGSTGNIAANSPANLVFSENYTAAHTNLPILGISNVIILEQGAAGAQICNYIGTEAGTCLTVEYNG